MTRWLETESLSNQDISSALAIGAYTADADRLVLVQFFADQVAGNGDYVFYVTQQVAGAGSHYRLIPITTAAAASGLTAIGGQSGMIAVRNGDVLTVYLDGLAGDNSTPDTAVRWFELAALRPTTADRTLDVSAGGEAGVDWANVGSPTTTVGLSGTTVKTATDVETDTVDIQARLPAALVGGRIDANAGAISADATAADNLETMLDGTGGQVLSLKQIDIVNSDGAPGGQGIDITARTGIRIIGSDQGISATGGTNQALYLATSTGAATIYVEGPSDGTGSAIAISSPGATPAGTSSSGEAVWIETSDGHPALRVDFGAAGGDIMDVIDSDNGDWVWDDKVFSALTAQDVRDAMKLAPTAGAADTDSVDDGIADIQTRLPAALVSGRIDASVGAVATGAITAAAIAADAIGASELAADAIAEIADAVLDEVYTSHTTAATLGAWLNAVDTSAVTVTTSNDAGVLTIYRGVTFTATVSGLTISASWTKVYLTIKSDLDLADTAATVQVVETNPGAGTDGLLYLNGAAPVSPIVVGDAALVVNQAAGTVAITLSDNATAQLARARSLHWDLKEIVSGTTSSLLTTGSADVELTPTRTV